MDFDTQLQIVGSNKVNSSDMVVTVADLESPATRLCNNPRALLVLGAPKIKTLILLIKPKSLNHHSSFVLGWNRNSIRSINNVRLLINRHWIFRSLKTTINRMILWNGQI